MTATFGNDPSATLPVINVDDHPTWRQHQRQREELAATLAVATDDVGRPNANGRMPSMMYMKRRCGRRGSPRSPRRSRGWMPAATGSDTPSCVMR